MAGRAMKKNASSSTLKYQIPAQTRTMTVRAPPFAVIGGACRAATASGLWDRASATASAKATTTAAKTASATLPCAELAPRMSQTAPKTVKMTKGLFLLYDFPHFSL